MKIYDFTSRQREAGRVVFALTLIKTRKRLAERIIIGRENEVRFVLNGGEGEVYYDEVRPLGSLLFGFEADRNGLWNTHLATLRESRPRKPLLNTSRWKNVAPVSEFLTAKYNSGEPSAMFAAIHTWEDYLNFYPKENGHQILNDRLFTLYKPFSVYCDYKPWQKEAVAALSVAVRDGESQVELLYPTAKRSYETVMVFSSFLPVISYYLNKIEGWKLVFQQCKVCGKYFLARSGHYELCSDKCRKVKAVEAKREYNERTKDDMHEQLYDTAYQYWYNRWRKIRKDTATADAAAAFKAAFDDFRKEAVTRKKAIKSASKVDKGKLIADFKNWIFRQQGEADRLMEEVTAKGVQ